MLTQDKLSRIYDHALNHGVDALSTFEQELYLIQDFIIELEMGGLSGYFYNRLPLNNHISRAVSAMKKHGLSELADLLGEAYQLFNANHENERPSTWAETLRKYDPSNRLSMIEKSIDSLENYGIDNP